jgi:NADH:ubiquinone reductase (H+-translocating)
MKRVIIVGMGFGGIRAARELAGNGLEVVMLDRNNYHLFQPLLYQVATAALEQESIAYPIRAMARRWPETRFRLAEVCGVDLNARKVMTSEGPMEYDYLIVSAGSETNHFGMTSIAEHSYDLKKLEHAETLRNQILGLFERAVKENDPEKRRAMLTFVIVGGGPTGVEFSGSLVELVRYVLAKDYPELSITECRVMLVEASDTILVSQPENLRKYAVDRLRRMGVEVLLNTKVIDAAPEHVVFGDGAIIPTHTLFWSAGVKAAPLAGVLDLPKAGAGRIKVKPDLTVEGHPEVYVIGDMACCEQDGTVLPMVAPVAMQMGAYAGKAILARQSDKDLPPFRYHDKGSMATIGRSSAVASAFGFHLSGYLAWVAWLALHLMYLVGFRNRVLVIMNWGWYYLFHERQVRLITMQESGPPQCSWK